MSPSIEFLLRAKSLNVTNSKVLELILKEYQASAHECAQLSSFIWEDLRNVRIVIDLLLPSVV